MSVLIAGAAGFIGSNIAHTLITKGEKVLGIDDLSRGSLLNLESVLGHSNFEFIQLDINEYDILSKRLTQYNAKEQISEVWHMAANSDIMAGVNDPQIDLQNTFMTTFNILKAMNENHIPVLCFASSSAIYGDLGEQKLVENIGPLFPISNYGAMKLASEAIISASVEKFVSKAFIYRFPNVIGVPATHGVILDFFNKLKSNPDNLIVLGDGTQRKSYLHVEELIDAMFEIKRLSESKLNCYNIGPQDEGVTVRFIAEQVVKEISPKASITYGKENRGWVGDVPKFTYSIEKLLSLGWKPKLTSEEAIIKTIKQISSLNN